MDTDTIPGAEFNATTTLDEADYPKVCQCPAYQRTKDDFCVVCGYPNVTGKVNTCRICAPGAW